MVDYIYSKSLKNYKTNNDTNMSPSDNYRLDFVSSPSGKLKVRFYFGQRIVKCKTLALKASMDDIKNPSPMLLTVMTNILSEFNDRILECMISGKSPVRFMFVAEKDRPKTPSEYFKYQSDFRLSRWREFIGSDISWGDITDELVFDYTEHLISDGISTNSIRTYQSGLKKALDDAKMRDYKFPSRAYPKLLKSSMGKSNSIYLTVEELNKIRDVELSPKMDEVRVKFLIGAYTGARYSDSDRLTEADISTGELVYISEKTDIKTFVPVHPSLPALLSRGSVDVSLSQINRIMPVIAELAGVDSVVTTTRGGVTKQSKKFENVKSHTARRTFATNVYLSGEYDLRSVSKMLGHSSVNTTEDYIQCGVYPVKKENWSYFK